MHCNDAVEWLHETGAILFAVEHRYYGCHNMSACPVTSFSSPDDLRYLSSAQALEDLALFIGHATAAYNLTGCAWVAWGGRCALSATQINCYVCTIVHASCSYPGMLAGWLRLKFPNLVHAAVASSAPVRIVVEMRECGASILVPSLPLTPVADTTTLSPPRLLWSTKRWAARLRVRRPSDRGTAPSLPSCLTRTDGSGLLHCLAARQNGAPRP